MKVLRIVGMCKGGGKNKREIQYKFQLFDLNLDNLENRVNFWKI